LGILDDLTAMGLQVAVRDETFIWSNTMKWLTDPARILEPPTVSGNT
jgi:hypothetical protein